jgi:hypothetical protein
VIAVLLFYTGWKGGGYRYRASGSNPSNPQKSRRLIKPPRGAAERHGYEPGRQGDRG